jgi:lysophospholipase L1-like esterase
MKVTRLRHLLALILTTVVVLISAQSTAPAATARSWDYVALGDSVATGFSLFGTVKGYVPRYEAYVEADTGATVKLTNLARNGSTSAELLYALRNNSQLRQAVKEAEVVTWNIGGNDLRAARNAYKNGNCGGSDNQDCLRRATRKLKSNWDAIIIQVKSLRSTQNTIIRAQDIYNPYVDEDRASDSWTNDGGVNDFRVFKPYLDRVNRHIARSSTDKGIPYAKVYRAFNGIDGTQDPEDKGYIGIDGLHPNDKGHAVIATKLRELRYRPLGP